MSLTYKQVIKTNRDFADAHHIIKNFGAGDAWDIVRHNQEADYKYPLMWMEDMPQTSGEKTFTYGFRVWFIQSVPELKDRGNDLMGVNENEAKSNMIECAKDLLSYWENNTKFPTTRLEKSLSYTTFTDKLEDRVTGVYIDFRLTVPFNYNQCTIPMTSDMECDPVRIFENGILIETVASGGSYSYTSQDGGSVTFSYESTPTGIDTDSGSNIDLEANDSDGINIGSLSTNTPTSKVVSVSDSSLSINGSSLIGVKAEGAKSFEIVDQNDNPLTVTQLSDTNTNYKGEITVSSDPVTIDVNGVVTTPAPSGGNLDINVRDSLGNDKGTLSVDTTEVKQIDIDDSLLTVNGSAITPLVSENNRTITIRYADGSPVVITPNTDNSTTFIGEIPNSVSGIAYVRNGWMVLNDNRRDFDLGWYLANTTDFDYNVSGITPILDPNDRTKLLTDNAFGNKELWTNDLGGTVIDGSDGSTADYGINHFQGLGYDLRAESIGASTWATAAGIVRALTFAGFSDWRMVTISEANQIVTSDAAQDGSIFDFAPKMLNAGYYWMLNSIPSGVTAWRGTDFDYSNAQYFQNISVGLASSLVRNLPVRNHY